VSSMVTPTSEVYWTVDQGPKTLALVQGSISVAIPKNNTAKTVPYHTVELFVKSTTERANRWKATGPSTRVILTGIVTDGLLAPWVPLDINILVYGDSITEGVLALGGSQKFDTDHNDGSVVYSYVLGRLLGAEVGVVGFGYNALTHPGSGGVAPLGEAWNQLWDGVPRSFTTPKPDLIVMNEGTNDGCDTTKPGCVGTDITKPMTAVLKDLVGACPSIPIVVLQPFNGGQTAHLQAAVKASGSSDVHFLSTAGFYKISLGGSLHPTGMNDVAQIAPKIAKSVRPLLYKSVMDRWSREL
jgi:lysophospholipase L1-like esterase